MFFLYFLLILWSGFLGHFEKVTRFGYKAVIFLTTLFTVMVTTVNLIIFTILIEKEASGLNGSGSPFF